MNDRLKSAIRRWRDRRRRRDIERIEAKKFAGDASDRQEASRRRAGPPPGTF
jgi:hypothetical protein